MFYAPFFSPSAQPEHGTQNTFPSGEGLGTSGIRHIFQVGDRCNYPARKGSTGSGNLQAPSSRGQCTRFQTWLRGGGDPRVPGWADPHRRGWEERGGDRGQDSEQPDISPQQIHNSARRLRVMCTACLSLWHSSMFLCPCCPDPELAFYFVPVCSVNKKLSIHFFLKLHNVTNYCKLGMDSEVK